MWFAQGRELSEESKTFRETFQKTAGMPARMRAEEARDAASGGTDKPMHTHMLCALRMDGSTVAGTST